MSLNVSLLMYISSEYLFDHFSWEKEIKLKSMRLESAFLVIWIIGQTEIFILTVRQYFSGWYKKAYLQMQQLIN